MLNQGRVVANGALTDVFSQLQPPLSMGENIGVVVDARVIERDPERHLIRTGFAGGELWVRDGGDELDQIIRIRILARDISLALANHDDSSILNRLQGKIIEMKSDRDPAMLLMRLQVGSVYLITRLTKRSAAHLQLETGISVWAQIKSLAVVR